MPGRMLGLLMLGLGGAGLLASPAAAQGVAVDAAAVEACFESAGWGRTDPDCIGQPAAACSAAQQPPDTTIAISQCMMAEAEAWDVLLNREYGTARERLAHVEGVPDTLLSAQRSWIALRDADCAVAYDKYDGGSMRVISAADCRLRHTARRTFELHNLGGF